MNDPLTFPCSTPDCPETVTVSRFTAADEWFDPNLIVCDEHRGALVPDDVRAMQAAPMPAATRCVSCGESIVGGVRCWSCRLVDMPLPNRFVGPDPRLTDAEVEAWHMGALMDEATAGYDAELDLDLFGVVR